MPILKIVVACEKVIYDQDGPASVISMFDAMKFRLQEAPLPERAIVPNQWAVFTSWEIESSELNQPFTQLVKIIAPDGSIFHENEHAFASNDPDRIATRIRLNMRSLPIWQEGVVQVKVFLKGDESERGCTSFRIVYLPKEAKTESAQEQV